MMNSMLKKFGKLTFSVVAACSLFFAASVPAYAEYIVSKLGDTPIHMFGKFNERLFLTNLKATVTVFHDFPSNTIAEGRINIYIYEVTKDGTVQRKSVHHDFNPAKANEFWSFDNTKEDILLQKDKTWKITAAAHVYLKDGTLKKNVLTMAFYPKVGAIPISGDKDYASIHSVNADTVAIEAFRTSAYSTIISDIMRVVVYEGTGNNLTYLTEKNYSTGNRKTIGSVVGNFPSNKSYTVLVEGRENVSGTEEYERFVISWSPTTFV